MDDSDIPYFFRILYRRLPEDWPAKGAMVTLANGTKKRFTAHELRVEYVRKGLVTYRDEYLASKKRNEPVDLFDLMEAA